MTVLKLWDGSKWITSPATGPTGPAGPTGPQGPQGPQGVGAMAYTRVSGNYQALAGQLVLVTNSGYTITLPPSPNDGDMVGVIQNASSGSTTVSSNKSIQHGGGGGLTFVLQASGPSGSPASSTAMAPSCFFVYSSYTTYWHVYAQSNPQSLVPYTIGSYNATARPWDFTIATAVHSPFALTLPTAPPQGTLCGGMAVGGTMQFIGGGSDVIQTPGVTTPATATTLTIAQGASKTLIYSPSVWYPTN